jgi:hypothetical protein
MRGDGEVILDKEKASWVDLCNRISVLEQDCARKDKAIADVVDFLTGEGNWWHETGKSYRAKCCWDAAKRLEALAEGKPFPKRCEFLLDDSDSICNAELPCTEHS